MEIQPSSKTSKLSPKLPKIRLGKKSILVMIVALFVFIVLIIGVYIINTKSQKPKNNTSSANVDGSNSYVQPLTSPNAGRPTGLALEQEITKAKQDADKLAAEVAAMPAPTNNQQETELSKKNLELGKAYYLSAQYDKAMTTLNKVKKGNLDSLVEAQHYLAKTATITGNKQLAIKYYDTAIHMLETASQKGGTAIDATTIRKSIDDIKAEKVLVTQ